MCHCGNTGVKQTPNKSQHTKLTLEKKILPPLLPGFELAAFRSRVQRSNQQVLLARASEASYFSPFKYTVTQSILCLIFECVFATV